MPRAKKDKIDWRNFDSYKKKDYEKPKKPAPPPQPPTKEYDFTQVKEKTLERLGYRSGYLDINEKVIEANVQFEELCRQVQGIYKIYSDKGIGRALAEAFLHTLYEPGKKDSDATSVMLYPGFRWADGWWVQIEVPQSTEMIRFSGTINYVFGTYQEERDREFFSKYDAVKFAAAMDEIVPVSLYQGPDIDEACLAQSASQAIATSIIKQDPAHTLVQYCITTGHSWMFCIFSESKRAWYNSRQFKIVEPREGAEFQGAFKKSVQIIAQLLHFWVTGCPEDLPEPLFTLSTFEESSDEEGMPDKPVEQPTECVAQETGTEKMDNSVATA